MTVAYLGLGSNVGDRLTHLRSATELLDQQPGIAVLERSPVFVTEPVGELLDQPDFYNAALRIETELEPDALLAACKTVEQALGRRPGGPRHGPRPIDVDLLIVGDHELVSDSLTLPHPQVTSRRFVLAPLLELDPQLELPDGTRLSATLDRLGPGQAVERLDQSLA